MAYTPYYAPYYRPMNYYNPSIPQDNQNMQNGQQFQQIPVQQPQQVPMQTPIQQAPMAQPTPMPSNDMLWVLNETEATDWMMTRLGEMMSETDDPKQRETLKKCMRELERD